MSRPAAFARLVGAAWVLIRADALTPVELDPALPPATRQLTRALRLFAGPRPARDGPASGWRDRWSIWVPPPSSSAKCCRPGPTSSAAPSPRTCRG